MKSEEEKEEKFELPPDNLEGEVRDDGWSVRFKRQDEKYVYFNVSCMSKDRWWYSINVKCPKKKFRKT